VIGRAATLGAQRAIRLKLAVLLAPLLALGLVGGLLFLGGVAPEESQCGGAPGAGGITIGDGTVQYPLAEGTYRISSGYGPRGGTMHRGVDFAAPVGTPMDVVADGVVREAGPADGFGLWAVVDHHAPDGSLYSTVYGHNDRNLVTAGQVVEAGDQIATVGNRGQSTGPHLHFEVWPGGRLDGGTSTDPIPWLQANAGTASGGAGGANAPPVDDATDGGDTAELTGPVPPQGTQVYLGSLTPEQQSVVDAAVGVVKGRGLPLRAAVLAVAGGAQESQLRNITYGDRDSEGYLQQRPSQGWGTPEQIRDPVYATGKFLDVLVGVAGWESMALTDAVQAVQRSGFPEAYAKWEQQAIDLVAAAAGVAPIGPGGTAPAGCAPGQQLPGGAATADGAIIPAGLATVTAWPAQPQNVPDPTGTGGLVTQRTADGVAAIRAAGYGGTGITCWDEHAWNPASDHPRGLGCDVMFAPYPTLTPQGWAAANWLVEHQAELGIKYLIWDGMYWSASSPDAWIEYRSSVYGCPNPAEVTGCHYDHIHVSYY
jgi:hypothetical protein